jgi:hypothetical protein
MDVPKNLRGAVGFSLYKKGGFFGLLAKAIRFFTGGVWSHTFVCFIDDETTGSWVIEAGELGVSVDSFKKYLDPKTYDVRVYMPLAKEENIDKALKRVMRLNGKAYGYAQLLGFIWIWLVRKLTGQKVHNPIGGGWICSELALDYCKDTGVDHQRFEELDRDSTSPKELDDIIKPSQHWKLIFEQVNP